MSSVPVVSHHMSTPRSQSQYNSQNINQSLLEQDSGGPSPKSNEYLNNQSNHSHINGVTACDNTEIIVQEDYEHGYTTALPIPHVPLNISDLTLDSPSEDDASVVDGFRVNTDNAYLPQRSLVDWTSEDITDWCMKRDMLSFAEIFDGKKTSTNH